jgi:hypothetical protein
MANRLKHPVSPQIHSTVDPKEIEDQQKMLIKLMQGFRDDHGMEVLNDDYYGYLQSLGFYNHETPGPLVHDTNTTTVLHANDTSYKKTPIDPREDPEPNISQVALDNKGAELYKIQDFSEEAARRTLEKTHRILTDPIRKLQSQTLIDIRKERERLLDPRMNQYPLEKIISYDQMILKVLTMMLDRVTDVLDYNEKKYVFDKYELRPQGLQFYCEMTLTSDNPTTHFDFTDDSKNFNVPSNAAIFRYPRHNLLSLQIIFDSGTNLYYSTNEPNNSQDAYVKFTSAVFPAEMTIAPGQQVIRSLNIRAGGGTPAAVRLVGLY